jgi:hypothetical protein
MLLYIAAHCNSYYTTATHCGSYHTATKHRNTMRLLTLLHTALLRQHQKGLPHLSMLLPQRSCARIRKVYRTSACFFYTTHIKPPRTHNISDRLQWYTSYFVAVISGAHLISVSLFSAHFFISVAAMHRNDDIYNALRFNDSSDVFTVSLFWAHFFISLAMHWCTSSIQWPPCIGAVTLITI